MSKEQLYIKNGKKYFPVEPYMGVDNEIVLFCAFRYALGRMTYVVGSVADSIKKASKIMSDSDKSKYVKEIIEYYTSHGEIGMNMDTEVWLKLACYLDSSNNFKFEANYYNTDKWEEFDGFMFNGDLYSRDSYNQFHTTRNIVCVNDKFDTQIFANVILEPNTQNF